MTEIPWEHAIVAAIGSAARAQGISWAELAEHTGIARNRLYGTTPMSVDELASVADALAVSVSDLAVAAEAIRSEPLRR